MAEPIRILLGEMQPPLYHEFRRAIAAQSDMEVVGAPCERGMGLLVEVRRTKPEAIAIGARKGGLPGECSHLLSEFSDLKILAVVFDNRKALLYERRSQATPVTHESVEELIVTIRSAVRAAESSRSR